MRHFLLSMLILLLTGCAAGGTNIESPVTTDQKLTDVWKSANIAYQQKKWEESYQLYSEVSAQMKDADAEFRKGVSAFRLHNTQQAEASFERTLDIDPSHPKAMYNLAIINMSRGYAFLYEYVMTLPDKERSNDILNVLDTLEKFSNQ